MSLTIEKTIDLTTYEENTEPRVVAQLSIIHEAQDGEIVQYYIHPDSYNEGDKASNAIGVYNDTTKVYDYINYDELKWGVPKRRITSQRIDNLVVKAFPNIGAIAAYKLAYRNISRVIAPVNYRKTKYQAPTFTYAVNSDNTITFTITPPEKVTYNAYRIIMALDEKQIEHVTYDTTYTAPQAICSGTYLIYIIGYVNEGEITSYESDAVEVTLKGQYETWPNITPGAEIYNKAQIDAMFSKINNVLISKNAGKVITIGTSGEAIASDITFDVWEGGAY